MAIGEVKRRTITRSDGTSYNVYLGEYRDRDGKRRFVSDENKHKAQEKLRAAMNAVDDGIHAKGSITLGTVIDEYLYECEKRARRGDISNTHARSERGSAKRVPDNLKRMKLADFEHTGHIKEALDGLRDKGYAIRTVKAVRGTLSRVFDFAMQPPRRYVPRNVLRDYPIRLGKAPKRQNAATIEEGAIVLRAAAERQNYEKWLPHLNLYAALCLIMLTGMRPEEAFGLQVEDIKRFREPPPDRPNIWAELLICNTNTREDGFQHRTKNLKTRIVPVGRNVLNAFSRIECYWQAEREANEPGRAPVQHQATRLRVQKRLRQLLENPGIAELRQHGPMFVGQRGKMLNSSTAGTDLRRLLIRAGLVQRDEDGRILIGPNGKPKAKYSFYSFRKMVATHNAHHLPTHVGASVTGHTEKVYLETYVHRSAADDVLVAKSLGELERALDRELNGEEVVIETKLIEAKPPQAEAVAAITRSKRRPLPPMTPGDGGNHDR